MMMSFNEKQENEAEMFEKRQKEEFDKLMNLEQQRLEQEERHRKEEREHEFCLFQMMTNMLAGQTGQTGPTGTIATNSTHIRSAPTPPSQFQQPFPRTGMFDSQGQTTGGQAFFASDSNSQVPGEGLFTQYMNL